MIRPGLYRVLKDHIWAKYFRAQNLAIYDPCFSPPSSSNQPTPHKRLRFSEYQDLELFSGTKEEKIKKYKEDLITMFKEGIVELLNED